VTCIELRSSRCVCVDSHTPPEQDEPVGVNEGCINGGWEALSWDVSYMVPPVIKLKDLLKPFQDELAIRELYTRNME